MIYNNAGANQIADQERRDRWYAYDEDKLGEKGIGNAGILFVSGQKTSRLQQMWLS